MLEINDKTNKENNCRGQDNLKRKLCNELIRQGKVKEGDIIRHSYTNSRFDSFHIENKDNPDCCSTIATRADCIGVVVKDMIEVEDKNGNKFLINDTKQLKETIERNELEHGTSLDLYNRSVHNDGVMQTIDTGYHNSQRVCVKEDEKMIINPLKDKTEYGWHFEQNVYDKNGETRALKASQGSGNMLKVIEGEIEEMNNYRIRKLTPLECFKLQGVKEEDFRKVEENQSNASLYHLAGDSITTSVLMAIFGEIFGVDYENKIHELEKSIAPDFDWSKVIKQEKKKGIKYEQASLLDLL